MKYVRLLLVFALVCGFLSINAGQASAMKFTYTTGIQVQNLANSAATISLSYVGQQGAGGSGGTEVTSATANIAALASATFFPIHAAAGFNGSVVISSSQPLAAITNLVASQTGSLIGSASYIGLSSGSNSLNIPWLSKNNYGFDSWFGVQNTGATDANVSVAYSDGTNAGPVIVKPGASYVFDQTSETHTPKVFAAKVTSDQPVAAVVVQENSTGKTLSAFNAFGSAGTSAVLPLVNVNNYGFITGVQIQNTGAVASDITLSYTPVGGIGTACTEKQTVAAGASSTFALGVFTYTAPAGTVSDCVKGQRFVGSAKVTGNTGDVPVVAIVNQQTSRSAGAYGGFDPATSTAKVVLPLIMDRNYGWYTGFNLQNVGAGDVTVNCTFSGTAYALTGVVLTPGQALNDIQNNKIANRYVGSGTCTATGTNPQIAAVVNEISPDATDNLLVYEGINVAP